MSGADVVAPDGFTAEEWTCAGFRLYSGTQPTQEWIRPDGAAFGVAFKGKDRGLVAHAAPGNVYRVIAGPSHVKTSGQYAPVYVRSVPSPELAALSRAAEAQHINMKAAGKAGKRDDLREMLAPIRLRYMNTIRRSERAALLATIIDAVTGGAT